MGETQQKLPNIILDN